jgi:pentatricopeptide repeat protein
LKLGEEYGNRKGRYLPIIPEEKRRVLRSTQGSAPGDDLEILFEKSLQAPSASKDVPPQSGSSLEPYKNAELLKQLLSGSPLADSWRFFVEHFGPDTMRPSFTENYKSIPPYVNSTAKELLRRIIHAKKADPLSQTLPSVTELSKVYLQLGRLHGPDWTEMMLILLQHILRFEQPPPATIEERLIADLLGAWNVVCRLKGNIQHFPPPGSEFLNWSYIPPVSSSDVNRMYRKRGPQTAFGILTPSFPVRHLEGIPMIALATFSIITNDSDVAKTISASASPFIALLSQIISVPGLALDHVYGRAHSPSFIADFVKSNWTTIRERASQISQSRQEAPERLAIVEKSFTDEPFRTSFINKRLKDALNRQNVREVDEMWSDVVQWPINKIQSTEMTNSHQPYSMKRGTLTEELSNYFILIYMSLRQPNRAIDVWNHMLKSGLQPTLKTWDAMLSGCKASRDWMNLESVWSKMQASGVQPDVFCWTTRISGLIESYKVDSGIRALDEMGRIWLAAARKAHPKMKLERLRLLPEIGGAVKPTIQTINGAVAGLLRKQSPDAAHRILAWAGKYGITPDIITYNTLLRPLVRHGHTKEATSLLQQMQKAGIQADVATFTTILEETFRYSEHHTPEESRKTVDSIFYEMEEAGVTANLHTYAKIIYQLLQSSNENMLIVNAVMERMAKHGLQPSPQIHTSLVAYYFDQTPANLDAVRGVIERATMVVGGTDHFFWDRVVEGYARAGQTSHALRILGKVRSANQKVGYLALRMLLFALVKNEEWDSARSLVRNVILDTGGPLPEDVHGKLGEHKFWELAANLQLSDEVHNL